LQNPAVAILGARQVGKTALARTVARSFKVSTYFDLETREDAALLETPDLALAPKRGLVVIDEVQTSPDVFRALRPLLDRPRTPARFLLLGSASPELVSHTVETLAGRIAFYDLEGFDMAEVRTRSAPEQAFNRLWVRGGFPRSFLARTDEDSAAWRRDFVRTFLDRDVPRLGIGIAARAMDRFWGMLAHVHGGIFNASELGRSLGVSHTTVRSYLDVLVGTLVVRELRPFAENMSKRLVKSPKVFVADSGLLHSLLGIVSMRDLERHPKLGASWEGFILDQLIRHVRARPEECFFWATHAGAELDLLVSSGGRRLGFEIKRTDAPKVTPSMRSALADLRLDSLDVIHAGTRTHRLAPKVRAVAAMDMLREVRPLRRTE
jgi:predicted AAA+ superfamily ATPase